MGWPSVAEEWKNRILQRVDVLTMRLPEIQKMGYMNWPSQTKGTVCSNTSSVKQYLNIIFLLGTLMLNGTPWS